MAKRKFSRRDILKLGAGAVGGLGVVGLPRQLLAATAKLKPTIKIGCQGTASGLSGTNGDFMRKGALLAVEEINANGGILGSKIEFDFRDDEGKVDVAIKNARYFVDRWGADFLMGIDSSSVALAVGRVMPELNRILIVTHGSTNKYNEDLVYKQKIKQCFRVSVPLYQDGISSALLAKDMPYTRWAAIVPDYEYGHTALNLFKQTLKSLKPQVEFVAHSLVKPNTVDFAPHISKVMAVKPEAILCCQWGGELVALIKQAKLFKVFEQTKAWVVPIGGAMDALQGLGKDYPEGLWLSTRYWFRYPDTSVNRAFVERYQKRWQNYPSHNSESAYVALQVIKMAVEKAESLDIDSVIAAMEDLHFNRPAGECYIRKEDHQAIYSVPWGQSKHDPKYPFAILSDLKVFPAADYYRRPPFPPIVDSL